MSTPTQSALPPAPLAPLPESLRRRGVERVRAARRVLHGTWSHDARTVEQFAAARRAMSPRPDAGHAHPGALAVVATLAWVCVWLGLVFTGCVLIVAGSALVAWRMFTVHLRDDVALLIEMEMGG